MKHLSLLFCTLSGAVFSLASAQNSALAQAQAALPPDSAYVQVRDGHLSLNGKRVRYWGFVGWTIEHNHRELWQLDNTTDDAATRARKVAKARRDIDAMVERVRDLGFNLVRNWEGKYSLEPFTMGDGSRADLYAYYINKLDEAGIKVWESGLNDIGKATPEDATIISDPKTEAAWREAVRSWKGDFWLRSGFGDSPGNARTWDERLEKLGLRRMKAYADFRNPYKKNGLRWGDDPQVVTWELSNEEIWMWGMTMGRWQNLPPYFTASLSAKWQEFLRRKYGGETALLARWRFLLPGESLEQGTIQLLPLQNGTKSTFGLNDTNPAARRALEAATQNGLGRADFTRARGEDILEFFTQLTISHKKRLEKELRTWGKSCRLTPLIWDSANPYNIGHQYAVSHGDAISSCSYVHAMAHDPTDGRFPFRSGLDESPRLCWDVPWLEQSTMPGKPTFVYETQIGNRTKYRAEWPFRVASLAAIQDWDIVNWHIFGHHTIDTDSQTPIPRRPLHTWHDNFGYGDDEVQLSAMKAASEIFKNGLLPPAPKPTTFIFGRQSIFDPAQMDYGKSFGDNGLRILPTTYRYGSRVVLDPTRETDEIIGPNSKYGILQPNPIGPHPAIQYDYQKAQLVFDAPGALSYVGFWGNRRELTWKNGLKARDVKVVNPPKMPYPVRDDEKYVAISLVSQDGLPLEKSKKALLSAVSTSFNASFQLDTNKTWAMDGNGPTGPLAEHFGAQNVDKSQGPVLVARVGLTLQGEALRGWNYTLRDWSLKNIGSGKIKGDTLQIPADKEIFWIELSR